MKIAINGFGRIGRQIMHIIMQKKSKLEVVAINDLTDNKTLAHLFEYDSTYGRYPGKVGTKGGDTIVIDGKPIKIYAVPEPEKLPWKKLGVDLVMECSGRFVKPEEAARHLKGGAKRVLVSAPCKGDKGPDLTVVMGVNEKKFDPKKHKVL